MPRGIAVVYSILSNIDLFNSLEKVLNRSQIYMEHPDTNFVQVWNSIGEALEVNKKDVFALIETGKYVVNFWDSKYDSISIEIYRENENLNNCTIYLDGVDTDMSFEIFIALLNLSLENQRIKGFVFDRRELSEGVNWIEFFTNLEDIRKFIKQKELEIIFEEKATEKNIDFDIDNVYIVVRKLDAMISVLKLR